MSIVTSFVLVIHLVVFCFFAHVYFTICSVHFFYFNGLSIIESKTTSGFKLLQSVWKVHSHFQGEIWWCICVILMFLRKTKVMFAAKNVCYTGSFEYRKSILINIHFSPTTILKSSLQFWKTWIEWIISNSAILYCIVMYIT